MLRDTLTEELRRLVKDHGLKMPKRHGYWIIFPFPREGTMLRLDTWNGALHYQIKDSISQALFYFGMNSSWDRSPNRAKQPQHIIQFYIDKLNNELKRRNK
jgi:hypothetical protein